MMIDDIPVEKLEDIMRHNSLTLCQLREFGMVQQDIRYAGMPVFLYRDRPYLFRETVLCGTMFYLMQDSLEVDD